MHPEEFDLPVTGGNLRVCRWPGVGPAVIAVHGITANALSFGPLSQTLAGRVQLVAPDLRGRAGSGKVGGPYGLATHADDIVALLDHLGQPKAVLVGHSMGGFVAAVAAVRHPTRVAGVLLVDGGVSFASVPQGGDIDAILEAVIGPALRRLQMTFPTPESYLDFWRAHPALRAQWSPWVEAYALRDLDGERSSCNPEAIRADGHDTLVNELTTTAFRQIACPASMLWAERGMLDEPAGLYNESTVPASLNPEKVKGVNHYTILMSERGASAVAEKLLALL
ncbi:MAG TPA: alpha/beta hydrolase [Candidatus Limnocylindrales bacterium]